MDQRTSCGEERCEGGVQFAFEPPKSGGLTGSPRPLRRHQGLASLGGAAGMQSAGASLVVAQDVHQLAKGIAHEEPAHAPGLVCRAVFDRDVRPGHARERGVEVVDFD